jgi:hypothetical protein
MKTMNKNFITVAATALLTLGAGNAAALTNFEADVNAAIDAGLAYSRASGQFTTYTEANGLTLLTLLEKAKLPAGYNGLDAADQKLARQSACILIDNGNFGDRGGFYSYYDGQVLMALSVYALTGGPNIPGEVFSSYDCSARTVRDTIDKVVDRSIAAQSTSGACIGYWGYAGPGCDSSTTQFTASGLGAAKGYYLGLGDPGGRLPGILTTLDRTSNGYSANGKVTTGNIWDTCGPAGAYPAGCLGHGYQVSYGAPGSNQQTASGTWLQLLGTGKNVNNPSVQGYMRWLQNAYNYDNNTSSEGWPPAYFYYLWSSSKAYNLMEGTSVDPGNIGPASLGTLPALTSGYVRLANRDPATDTRPAPRGAGAAGYYAGYPAGWYYDYAYRLMSLQLADGRFPNPNGTWDAEVDHAYALLVLQRSVGGIVVISKCDANGDQLINKTDLAIISAARGKNATGPNDPRDSDNDGKITILDVKKCVPLVH